MLKHYKLKFTNEQIGQFFSHNLYLSLYSQNTRKQKVKSDGFTLVEFVELMKNAIPAEDPREETSLVHGLITLFTEIDINGNGCMEWDEFTEFLIEAVDAK